MLHFGPDQGRLVNACSGSNVWLRSPRQCRVPHLALAIHLGGLYLVNFVFQCIRNSISRLLAIQEPAGVINVLVEGPGNFPLCIVARLDGGGLCRHQRKLNTLRRL